MYYYGSKTSKCRKNDIANPSTFWKTYFTSSKYVHQLIEQYGTHTFEIQRIKIFKTGKEAREWEAKFLSRINAASRDNWLNQYNQDGKFILKKHTEKTKLKMQKRKLTDEAKEKLRLKFIGEKNPNFGKELSDEHRKKISISKIGINTHTEKWVKAMSKLQGKNNPMFGKHRSDTVKEKLRQAAIEQWRIIKQKRINKLEQKNKENECL
jgi:hypothetical protein